MFYRFVGEERRAIDLENIHSDSCILVGGAIEIENEMQWNIIQRQGILTMAMNNVATMFKPTYWIGADKPKNYSKSILYDSSYLHFAYLSRCCEEIDGRHWKNFSNIVFMGGNQHIKANQFFHPVTHFVWWKNIFLVALQVLFHLGFRRIYTLGCSFNISKEKQYSFETNLNQEQVDYNIRTYGMVLNQLKDIMPYFQKNEFEIISCTANSRLNSLIDYNSFDDVIAKILSEIPKHDAINIVHPVLAK